MKLKLAFLLIFTLFVSLLGAQAQNVVPVIGSNITDASQAPLTSGSLCFQPVVASGNTAVNVTGFGVGGGGFAYGRAVCANVANGVMTTVHLASSAFSSPVGVQYTITVSDNNTGESWVAGIAYIASGTTAWNGTAWDIDNWSPTGITTLPSPGSGAITGNLTATGTGTFGGSVTAPAFHGVADTVISWQTLPNSCPAGFSPTSQDIHGNWLNCVGSSFQTSGSTPGVIAQNPAGNQMITLTTGSHQRVGTASAYVDMDASGNMTANGNANATNVVATVDVSGATAHIAGAAQAGSVNNIVNAALQTGADIGAKINAAFAATALSNSGTVYVPLGTYTYSTSISMPVTTAQSLTLECAPGTILKYTGPTQAFLAAGDPSTSQLTQVNIKECVFDGSSNTNTGANGVVFQGFYGITVDHARAQSFTTGSGWYFQGSGKATILDSDAFFNKYGVQLGGFSATSGPTAPNSVHWIGGEISHNTQWGWFDNNSIALSGNSFENHLEYAELAANGTSGTNSGHVDLEAANGMRISGNYFESLAGTENIQISPAVSGGLVVVDGNHFETPPTLHTIDLTFAMLVATNNVEIGASPGFTNAVFIHTLSSSGHYYMLNNRVASTTVSDGTGINLSSEVLGPLTATAGNAVTLQPGTGATNALQVTDPTGTFNALLVDSSGNATIHGNLSVAGNISAGTGISGTMHAGTCTLTVANGVIIGQSGC